MFSPNASNQAGPKSGQFIATMEHRQGLKIASFEDIAWRNGFLNAGQHEQLAQPLAANDCGQHMPWRLTKGAQP